MRICCALGWDALGGSAGLSEKEESEWVEGEDWGGDFEAIFSSKALVDDQRQ